MSVRSISWPACTIAAILPPPRCRKMSGASPELSAVCSLPSRSSFWIDCILIVTFGLAFSKAAIASFQYCWPGPVVEFCHSVMLTLPLLEASLVPLQAVSASEPAARTAAPMRSFLAFM